MVPATRFGGDDADGEPDPNQPGAAAAGDCAADRAVPARGWADRAAARWHAARAPGGARVVERPRRAAGHAALRISRGFRLQLWACSASLSSIAERLVSTSMAPFCELRRNSRSDWPESSRA